MLSLIDENDSISLKENTFTIEGKYGSKFSFDASMEFSIWLPPNTLERYGPSLRPIRNGARRKSNLGVHMEYLEASQATWKIDTGITDDGLGFCDFLIMSKDWRGSSSMKDGQHLSILASRHFQKI